MRYQMVITQVAERDLRKLPRKVRCEFFDIHLLRIADAPREVGTPLRGEFRGYWSYHFGRRPEYQVIYSIEEEIVTVTVFLVGSRENVYARLRRRLF